MDDDVLIVGWKRYLIYCLGVKYNFCLVGILEKIEISFIFFKEGVVFDVVICFYNL